MKFQFCRLSNYITEIQNYWTKKIIENMQKIMFYSESKIDELKKCSICKQELELWSKSFAMQLYGMQFMHKFVEFKCKLCLSIHAIPSNRFPVNEIAMKSLEKKIKSRELYLQGKKRWRINWRTLSENS
jgi:hypothetical protein